jgi:hypothetical protein
MRTLQTTQDRLFAALGAAQEMSHETPTRELSLVITKIEEAILWLGRVSEIAHGTERESHS